MEQEMKNDTVELPDADMLYYFHTGLVWPAGPVRFVIVKETEVVCICNFHISPEVIR